MRKPHRQEAPLAPAPTRPWTPIPRDARAQRRSNRSAQIRRVRPCPCRAPCLARDGRLYSCTANVNSKGTPAFKGPAGRCQTMWPPSGSGEIVESPAGATSGAPDHAESSPARGFPAAICGRSIAANKRPRIAARVDDVGENLIAASGHDRASPPQTRLLQSGLDEGATWRPIPGRGGETSASGDRDRG